MVFPEEKNTLFLYCTSQIDPADHFMKRKKDIRKGDGYLCHMGSGPLTIRIR